MMDKIYTPLQRSSDKNLFTFEINAKSWYKIDKNNKFIFFCKSTIRYQQYVISNVKIGIQKIFTEKEILNESKSSV